MFTKKTISIFFSFMLIINCSYLKSEFFLAPPGVSGTLEKSIKSTLDEPNLTDPYQIACFRLLRKILTKVELRALLYAHNKHGFEYEENNKFVRIYKKLQNKYPSLIPPYDYYADHPFLKEAVWLKNHEVTKFDALFDARDLVIRLFLTNEDQKVLSKETKRKNDPDTAYRQSRAYTRLYKKYPGILTPKYNQLFDRIYFGYVITTYDGFFVDEVDQTTDETSEPTEEEKQQALQHFYTLQFDLLAEEVGFEGAKMIIDASLSQAILQTTSFDFDTTDAMKYYKKIQKQYPQLLPPAETNPHKHFDSRIRTRPSRESDPILKLILSPFALYAIEGRDEAIAELVKVSDITEEQLRVEFEVAKLNPSFLSRGIGSIRKFIKSVKSSL